MGSAAALREPLVVMLLDVEEAPGGVLWLWGKQAPTGRSVMVRVPDHPPHLFIHAPSPPPGWAPEAPGEHYAWPLDRLARLQALLNMRCARPSVPSAPQAAPLSRSSPGVRTSTRASQAAARHARGEPRRAPRAAAHHVHPPARARRRGVPARQLRPRVQRDARQRAAGGRAQGARGDAGGQRLHLPRAGAVRGGRELSAPQACDLPANPACARRLVAPPTIAAPPARPPAGQAAHALPLRHQPVWWLLGLRGPHGGPPQRDASQPALAASRRARAHGPRGAAPRAALHLRPGAGGVLEVPASAHARRHAAGRARLEARGDPC